MAQNERVGSKIEKAKVIYPRSANWSIQKFEAISRRDSDSYLHQHENAQSFETYVVFQTFIFCSFDKLNVILVEHILKLFIV